MRGVFDFLRQHVGPAIILVGGGALALVSFVLDGLHVISLGLPWWAFGVAGLASFFSTVIVLLSRMHASIQGATQATPYGSPESQEDEITIVPTVDAPSADGRVFLGPEVTPEFLSGFYEDRTDLQATALLKPYLGKWMKVFGKVHEVWSTRPKTISVVFAYKGSKLLVMEFEEPWIAKVETLSKGNAITIRGRIDRVQSMGLHLDQCELAGHGRI